MPTRPPTFSPSKPNTPTHKPREADRQATRALHTGSKAWRAIRERVLVRDGYRCQACGKLAGPSAHIDHKANDAAGNAGWDLDTLQTLCQPCHASKSATEMKGRNWDGRKGFDVDGNPIGGW